MLYAFRLWCSLPFYLPLAIIRIKIIYLRAVSDNKNIYERIYRNYAGY